MSCMSMTCTGIVPWRVLVFVVGSVTVAGRVFVVDGVSEVRMSLCSRRKRAVFLRAGSGVVLRIVGVKVDSQVCVGGRWSVVR